MNRTISKYLDLVLEVSTVSSVVLITDGISADLSFLLGHAKRMGPL